MYAKLALRNVKRSAKDYLIYFTTLMLTATLLCAFLSLGFSKDIIGMTENMSMLTTGIVAFSILVAFISSFVVRYAVRFMLGQRKKEFATYELLGMEVSSIQKLFLMENSCIGTVSLMLGIVLGSFLSGTLAMLVKSIFDTPHSYRVEFSLEAILLTVLLFILTYGVGLLRASKIIRQRKIIDLLYDERKNEEVTSKSNICLLINIVIAILEIAVGLLLLSNGLKIQTNTSMVFLLGGVALIIASIYEVYRNMPYLLFRGAQKRKNYIYHEERLFLIGQLNQRLNSAGKVMAVIAILLTFSLITMFAGLTMGAGYKVNMTAYYPYDFGVAIDAPLTKDSFDKVTSFVNEKSSIQDSVTYYLYSTGEYKIEALSISDYNHLRSILGLSPKTLNDNEFFVHCDTWIYMDSIKSNLTDNPTIRLAGQELKAAAEPIFTEPMEQYQMAGTKGYVLVIPDQVASLLPAPKIRLAGKLADGGYPELKNELRTFLDTNEWKPEFQAGMEIPEKVTLGVTVKAWGVANSLTGYTAISFCGLYLSIVFIILSCTILAFEQLSRLESNRQHFWVISRLGVDRHSQKKLVFKELTCFFTLPLIIPMISLLAATIGVNKHLGGAILQENLIPFYGGVTLLIFFFIYGLYFGATNFIYKKNVLN